MSIFNDIHFQHINEKNVSSIETIWYSMQENVKNIKLDNLPLIIINGQVKTKYYDMADYIYIS